MILIDTNIWIDHIRSPEPDLAMFLARRRVRMHPFVVGEFMLGATAGRDKIRQKLDELLPVPVAPHDAVLDLIERERLDGSGIGYVDAHLLASCRLVPGLTLWTRDKRLRRVAERLSVAAALD